MSEPIKLKIRPPHEAARYLLDHLDEIGTDAAKVIALTLIVEDLLGDHARLRDELEAVAATCSCGTSPMTYEGPEADCPVHGAVRALNEATAERDAMRPVVEAAEAWTVSRLGSTPANRALVAAVDQYRSKGDYAS